MIAFDRELLVAADEVLQRGEVPTLPHDGNPVHVATRCGKRLLVKREHADLWQRAYFSENGLRKLAGWRPSDIEGAWDSNLPVPSRWLTTMPESPPPPANPG